MFKPVSPKVNFPELEEEIQKFWKENTIFEKSISSRPEDKKWTFLDGPPFVTGMPHYGHLLGSIHKDLFGRYWTMKGYRVRRVWGWDGHGLPIENKVEGKLDIKRKKDIEDIVGVKRFIEECKKYVEEISGEWEWYVDHIGRWVDFKNAYKTWDTPYMESVMWVFKQMYDKGHIYKGLKVTLYCPHCSTPISNFEVAMDADNYKEVPDSATTYKYELRTTNYELPTYILAWSTTPWNKIVTPALAVNPEFVYIKVKQNNEFYILAKPTVKILGDTPYEIIEEMKGKELIGTKFVPHYDYYEIKSGEKAFEVIGGDFVTAEEGTGVVTIAAYGEEDLIVMKEQNVHIELHVDEEGMIKDDVPKFGGMYYLKANKAVNEDLASRGLIYKDEITPHNVPLCWRCHTRLYYAPINAWYVNIQDMKTLLKKTNESIHWYPKHFKHGRFLKSLENAPDWNISRNRYWGSPVPVWECSQPADGCGERFVPGSIKELEEKSGRVIKDLHKPEIDEVTVPCDNCGKQMHRVPEVLDSWIEAGSASFAERHYPFGSPSDSSGQAAQGKPTEKLEDFFPPDFIAEYTGQIRAWFYVLHVIGGALYQTPAFKNVGVEGVILGTDGRKMSKNLGNYPDPKELLGKYGGDALRLYLMTSPIMHGEDMVISEEQYRHQVRGMMLILWNVYNFFIQNATVDNWSHEPSTINDQPSTRLNILDQWIESLLNQLVRDVTKSLDGYDTVAAIARIKEFIDDLSTWYLRRSRDRVGPAADDQEDKDVFYQTTHHALVTITQLLAPIAPFISESMYKNLTGNESVHLSDWPSPDETKIDNELEAQFSHLRKIVEMGHAARKESNMKVRQPLQQLTISSQQLTMSEELVNLLKDELNVKNVVVEEGVSDLSVSFDFTLTPELEQEGLARDIIRSIQEERKVLGTSPTELVDVTLKDWPKEFEDEIKRKTLAKSVTSGDFSVKRIP